MYAERKRDATKEKNNKDVYAYVYGGGGYHSDTFIKSYEFSGTQAMGLNQRACIDLSLNVFDITLFILPPLMLHFVLSSKKSCFCLEHLNRLST